MDRPIANVTAERAMIGWVMEYAALCLRSTCNMTTFILLTTDDSPMFFIGSKSLENSVWSHPFAAPSCNGVRARLGTTAYGHVAEEQLWLN